MKVFCFFRKFVSIKNLALNCLVVEIETYIAVFLLFGFSLIFVYKFFELLIIFKL